MAGNNKSDARSDAPVDSGAHVTDAKATPVAARIVQQQLTEASAQATARSADGGPRVAFSSLLVNHSDLYPGKRSDGAGDASAEFARKLFRQAEKEPIATRLSEGWADKADGVRHAATPFGRELEERYKDRAINPQQRAFAGLLGDTFYGGSPPAEKHQWLIKQVDTRVRGWEDCAARAAKFVSEAPPWRKDHTDLRNKPESGYAKLNDEQKAFVDNIAQKFPEGVFTPKVRATVTTDAIARAKSGAEIDGKAQAEFERETITKVKEESGKEQIARMTEFMSKSAETFDQYSSIFDHTKNVARSVVEMTAGGARLNSTSHVDKYAVGMFDEKHALVRDAVSRIDGHAHLLNHLSRGVAAVARPLATAAPYAVFAGYATVGAYKAYSGDVKGGIMTGASGAFSVGVGVVGAIPCGGPETPVGVVCGMAAGVYAGHAWDTVTEKGAAPGGGRLLGEVLGVALSLNSHNTRDVFRSVRQRGNEGESIGTTVGGIASIAWDKQTKAVADLIDRGIPLVF